MSSLPQRRQSAKLEDRHFVFMRVFSEACGPPNVLRTVSVTADVRPRLHEAGAPLAACFLQHGGTASLLHSLYMHVISEV